MLWASVFNYERLEILRDTNGHPSKKLLSSEFAKSFCFQLRVSRYITGFIRTSELNVIVVWICSELLFSISSVSIYYETQSNVWVKTYCRLNFLNASVLYYGIHSNIWVKSYCRLILLRAFALNFEHVDILWDTIAHPSKNLLSFEFPQSFCIQLRACRYITGFIRTSE